MGWRNASFRGYADYMQTTEFAQNLASLMQLAKQERVAIMCAEAVPWRCHRQLLADAFLVRGWAVRHILEDRCEEHRLPPFAKPIGTQILYPSL